MMMIKRNAHVWTEFWEAAASSTKVGDGEMAFKDPSIISCSRAPKANLDFHLCIHNLHTTPPASQTLERLKGLKRFLA